MKNTALLTEPISTLSLRQDTIQLAQAMGYKTLQDLFNTDRKDLFGNQALPIDGFWGLWFFLERSDLLEDFDRVS